MFASSSKHVWDPTSKYAVRMYSASKVWGSSLGSRVLPRVQQNPLVRHTSNYAGAHEFRNNNNRDRQRRPLPIGVTRTVNISPGTMTSRYNGRIQTCIERNHSLGGIKVASEMKKKGIAPDVFTYNMLIRCFGHLAWHQEAWSVYFDMEAVGIAPSLETFNILISAMQWAPSENIHNVLEEMKRHELEPDSRTYDLIINYYIQGGNLEMALSRLVEMNDHSFIPSLKTVQAFIELAVNLGHLRLAIDIASAYESESVRRLESETWVKLLIGSANILYYDGVWHAWKKVVREFDVKLDEGLCQAILHTAGRHSAPRLAAEVIERLEKMGVTLREQHFVHLLDAFARNDQIKEAFRVLSVIRANKVESTTRVAENIRLAIQGDPDAVDNAFSALEDIHKSGKSVDVTAVNVIIEAAAHLNDLQRCVGTYKAMPTLNVQPNSETFEILISACLKVKHVDLADRLFKDTTTTGIEPSAETYKSLIFLHLAQDDYENVFTYLEDMKARGYKPSYEIYEAIVRRLVSREDTRFKTAVQELKQMGYRVSFALQSFIDSRGTEWKDETDTGLPTRYAKSGHPGQRRTARLTSVDSVENIY